MIKLNGKERVVLNGLFAGHRTMPFMIQSVLEGGFGEVETDSATVPTVGRVSLAGFQYFAGDASSSGAEEMVKGLESLRSQGINQWVIPETAEWTALIQRIWSGTEYWTPTRYRMSHGAMDKGLLVNLAAKVPTGYRVVPMDEGLAERAAKEIEVYLTLGFSSSRDLVEKGFGYCAMKDSMMAGACTTFAVCRQGVEFEIDTHPDHTRRGLATCLAAKMVLETLRRGLEPSWDAAWDGSAELAKKLGFNLDKEYKAFVR